MFRTHERSAAPVIVLSILSLALIMGCGGGDQPGPGGNHAGGPPHGRPGGGPHSGTLGDIRSCAYRHGSPDGND